jgi:hypothetical protein
MKENVDDYLPKTPKHPLSETEVLDFIVTMCIE